MRCLGSYRAEVRTQDFRRPQLVLVVPEREGLDVISGVKGSRLTKECLHTYAVDGMLHYQGAAPRSGRREEQKEVKMLQRRTAQEVEE